MTKLFYKLFFVLLPVVILGIFFESVARKVPTSYSRKADLLDKQKEDVEVLVLGSSHANSGINPELFTRRGLNVANVSQGLNEDYQVLSKYLRECRKLKLVIVPISYFSLQTDLSKTPESWRKAYYSFYMGIGEGSAGSFDVKKKSALFLWDGPIEVINGRSKAKKININDYGYQSRGKQQTDTSEKINDASGRARVAYHEKNMDPALINWNTAHLEKMAQELKARNVAMVIVTPPVYKTYYRYIRRENYDVMTTAAKKLTSTYGTNFFNYFYDGRFEVSDFRDNDHLNAQGAEKFSRILQDEVVGPLMRDN